MALLIDDIEAAWRSLRSLEEPRGWRSIPVATIGPCAVRAGCAFPDKEEAILAGFRRASLPPLERLPEGQGFVVHRLDEEGGDTAWLALTRKPLASTELFKAMVGDVIQVLHDEKAEDDLRLARVFLGRVRAWQEFMRKGAQPLGPDAEVGLIGELVVLRAIIEAGVPAGAAVDAWVGPVDGLQDFELGSGAIEVKATVVARGFPARIGTLEQLDDSARQPLYLAGVRLAKSGSGENLPEHVESLQSMLDDDPQARRVFGDRIFRAGYLSAHSDRYPNRFTVAEVRGYLVDADFPRLTHGTVPPAVVRAAYDIDLEMVRGEILPLGTVLGVLGVI